MTKIRLGLQRKKARRFFLLLFFSSFLFLHLAQPLPVKASGEDERRIQQLLDQANQAAASGGINNLADLQHRYRQFERQTKKQYGSMDKAAKTWEKTQTALEYHDVFARVRWINYQANVKVPISPASSMDFHFNFSGTREFRGRSWKTFPTGPKNPPDYGFDWFDQAGPLQSASASANSHGGACQGTQWIVTENSHLKTHSSYLSPVPLYVTLNAGIQIPEGDCVSPPPFLGTKKEQMNGWGMTEDHPLEFVITKQDMDTFIKEGHWARTFSGVVLAKDPATVPPGKLFVLAPPQMNDNMNIKATVLVELFSGPFISGPRYIPHPVHKVQTHYMDQRVVLGGISPPRWTITTGIKPVRGEKLEPYLEKERETGPPHPTLTVRGTREGKVNLEIYWKDPKGKKGHTKPPFDLTVVEVRFEEGDRCSGFDEKGVLGLSSQSLNPKVPPPLPPKTVTRSAPALSVCENKTNVFRIQMTPLEAAQKLKVRLKPENDAFTVDPELITGFPTTVTVKGSREGHWLLDAFLEENPNSPLRAAQMQVDVLKPHTVTVQPFLSKEMKATFLMSIFDKANEILKQTCVEAEDKLPIDLDYSKPPFENQGIIYTSDDLKDHDSVNEERKNIKKFLDAKGGTYDMGIVFVRQVLDRLEDQNGAPRFKPLAGFQVGRYIFIPFEGFSADDLGQTVAHEVGHIIFKPVYGDYYHADNKKLLMFRYGKGCEIRCAEWQSVSRGSAEPEVGLSFPPE